MTRMYDRGLLKIGEKLIHDSIVGTQFTGIIKSLSKVGGYDAIIPEISGRAYITQHCKIVVEDDDPFPEGYTVGDIW